MPSPWKTEALERLRAFTETDEEIRRLDAVIRLGSLQSASKEIGINPGTLSRAVYKIAARAGVVGQDSEELKESVSALTKEHDRLQTTETEDGFFIEVESITEPIQTAEQAMRKAGLDSLIWEPIKTVANSWTVTIKQEDGTAKTCPQWQVKVTCRRRVKSIFENASKIALNELAKRTYDSVRHDPVSRPASSGEPSTLVVGLVDHHVGKLAWKAETGNNYDLKIAERLFSLAISAAIDRCVGREVAEIILPVGNDFAHIDTRAGTTESGTSLDHDARYGKLAVVMQEGLIQAVSVCRQVAPVRVVWVPGNHDYLTSYWLCRCVDWAFNSESEVFVDTEACPIKYHQFGRCLLGFAHGNAPKKKDLMSLMPIERPDDWAKSSACREWLTGHFHTQSKTERVGTHEEAGQIFRVLPSLCGTDAWHYANGFSMSRKAMESYLYSHRHGLTDIFQESAEKLTDGLTVSL